MEINNLAYNYHYH